jgi:hypothetical protein
LGKVLFMQMPKTLPYFNYLGFGTACKAVFHTTRGEEVAHVDGYHKTGTVKEMVETEESRERRSKADAQRAMHSRAAERAAVKARRARMEAAGESMKNVTDKAAQGRFRVEDGAAGKTMVYGKGDFTGHASDATTADHEKNQAEADRLRAEAAGTGTPGREMKEVERETGQRFTGDFKKVNATAEFIAGAKKERFKGPELNEGLGAQCQETSGAIKKTDCVATFTRWDIYVIDFANAFEKFLRKNVLASIYPKAKAKVASKDPASRAEGLLLSYLYGGEMPKDVRFDLETEKVFGMKRTFEEVMGAATYF